MKKTIIYLFSLLLVCSCSREQKIDRYALVTRHNIKNSQIDQLNSLTVGNGEFAFTADITGMQSFPDYYENGISLGTQSQWGWHSFPNPEKYSLEDVKKMYWNGSDSIPYVFQYTNDLNDRKNKASDWLRENPHRLHLGLIGLELLDSGMAVCTIEDVQSPVQELNLWTGELKSSFRIGGELVEISTLCHQQLDMVSFRISSELIKTGRLRITINFPYARHEKYNPGYDLTAINKHKTTLTHIDEASANFKSELDDETYFLKIGWNSKAGITRRAGHEYIISSLDDESVFELNCLFSKESVKNKIPSYSDNFKNNKVQWMRFWESGGAIDLSVSKDPRAFELERRIILSQYLTKIQCSGSLPPQETGLTYNSWHGKFHLEMHWWHATHFILWGRPELMEKQLSFYKTIIQNAGKTSQDQGYNGVRWPKMIGPDGRESPSTIGPFLIWQQPHLIYLAELLYNFYEHDPAVLETYKDLVFASADFMASYVHFDQVTGKYILMPPVIPAQECFNPDSIVNPVFELGYWRWGLVVAEKWRKRLGMEPEKLWQQIIDNLSDYPVKDSLYLFTQNTRNSYSNPLYMTDHPIVLGISGFLPPSEHIDKKIMENTLTEVVSRWSWETAWGWDFPLAAMSASSLDMPELAIDLLMMDSPKNKYLMNGHNYQDKNLVIYLPGNGALLTAMAMICANNGFPDNGKWKVRFENLSGLY